MKNASIKIELVQNGHVIAFTTQVSDEKLSVIAGTLAFRIVALMQRVKKFKMNLNGFSFARKFDVKISIGEEQASGTQTIMNGSVHFGLTLQDNQKSVDRFGEFIKELVCDILTGTSKAEIELNELLKEAGFSNN